MALHGHDSYLPLMDLFAASWALADAAALSGPGASALVVLDGVDAAGFGALRTELAAKRESVRAAALSVRLEEAGVRLGRAELGLRLGQFIAAVRVWWGRGALARVVPRMPMQTSALDKYLRPVRDALRLWQRMDAGVAPPGVVLPLKLGGEQVFGRGEMQALLAAVLAGREAVEEGELALTIARTERDAVERRVREVLIAFVAAVPVRLGTGHAVAQSLPRLYPEPGHTPEPVKLSGEWREPEGAARLSWEASGDEKLSHYQIRWCPGEVYNKREESVAGSVGKAEPRVFLTKEGLEGPGMVACYKVYVILETENERGSAPVTLRRDAG